MAVGTYTYKLPICDLCELPWIPVGWTQDSDPRDLPEGVKPLRCGKCKSIRWDWKFVKQQKDGDVTQMVRGRTYPSDGTSAVAGSNPAVPTITEPISQALLEWLDSPLAPSENALTDYRNSFLKSPLLYEDTKDIPKPRPPMVPRGTSRCKHRMTDCPICHPKEAT